MNSAEATDATSVILEQTGRGHLADALAWLAEGHPLSSDTDWPRLLRALIEVQGEDVDPRALRRVTREVTDSDLDTARLVFDPEELPSVADFDRALNALLKRSSGGGFAGLMPRDVIRAQRSEPRAIEALCLAAGIPESDARDWFGASGEWKEQEVAELLAYLDELVQSKAESPFPKSTPTRSLELMESNSGWETLDDLQANGVPYSLLLTQRAVGGVWLANKNRTSSRANQIAAGQVAELLEEQGIDFRRATTAGGTARQRDLQELSGIADKRVGVVALGPKEQAAYAITFSSARDGGTARANGDGLMQIPRTNFPHALVLIGVGWAARHETDRLAMKFDGRLFSDRSIDMLVEDVVAVCK